MAPKKRTTKTQFKIFVEYLEQYPVLRTGRLGHKQAPQDLDGLWDHLTTSLNSCGDGPVRSVVEWKKIFTEWKSATRKKQREKKELNDQEKKILQLTGTGATDGIEGIELGMPTVDEGDDEEEWQEETLQQEVEAAQNVLMQEEIAGTSAGSTETNKERLRDTTGNVQKERNGTQGETSKTRARKTTGDVLTDAYVGAINTQKDGLTEISSALREIAKAINRFCDITENTPQGAIKTTTEWQKAFWNWTYYVKNKARKIYLHRYITGGGGALLVILTYLEERLLQILGDVNISGMEGVKELGLQFLQKNKIRKNKLNRITWSTKKRRKLRPTKLKTRILKTFVKCHKLLYGAFKELIGAVITVCNAINRLINLFEI